MDKQKVEELEKILADANRQDQALRFYFFDGDIYDFAEFAVCQDSGEDYSHCTATVVHLVKAPEEKWSIFSEDRALLFHLNDVLEVYEPASNALLFSAYALD